MRRRRGRFVTFEGGEGAGKSTQIRLLAEWLKAQGVDVCVTREPGGTPGAERIRSLLVEGAAAAWTPMTEALLNYAARDDHVARVIRPAPAIRPPWPTGGLSMPSRPRTIRSRSRA